MQVSLVPDNKRNIAVIGSGIAGLSCAWLLSNAGHDVTIFERESRPGMDAYGIDLENGRRIDTPPRAFSEGFYPNLMGLYRCAGVEYIRWSWAFAASIYHEPRAYFRVGGGKSILGFRLPELDGSLWKLLVRGFGCSIIIIKNKPKKRLECKRYNIENYSCPVLCNHFEFIYMWYYLSIRTATQLPFVGD